MRVVDDDVGGSGASGKCDTTTPLFSRIRSISIARLELYNQNVRWFRVDE